MTSQEVSTARAAAGAPGSAPRFRGLRELLAIRSFRGLWLAGTLSSFGDWLALLATASLAAALAQDRLGAYLAVSGVFILRILPALVLGPFAGVVADRVDRRRTMIVGDVLRGTVFVSIPLVGTLWWMYLAIVLSECVSLFWSPAKDATVPNLVPRGRLELANQLNLVGSYGSAPVAALLFTGLTYVATPLHEHAPRGRPRRAVPRRLRQRRHLLRQRRRACGGWPSPAPWGGRRSPASRSTGPSPTGWSCCASSPPCAAWCSGCSAGSPAGASWSACRASSSTTSAPARRATASSSSACSPGWPWGWSPARARCGAWAAPGRSPSPSSAPVRVLVVLAVVPLLEVALVAAVALGACVGVAWVLGYTLLGLTVDDVVRGRTFALVQTLDGVVLVLALALAPLLAAGLDGVARPAPDARPRVDLAHLHRRDGDLRRGRCRDGARRSRGVAPHVRRRGPHRLTRPRCAGASRGAGPGDVPVDGRPP